MVYVFRFFVIVLLCWMIADMSCAYQIHGKVSSASGQTENISGAEIYEEYNDDKTVARTDENGEFVYETNSDVPVKLWARKKGFVDGRGYLEHNHKSVITKENTENVTFELLRWQSPETIKIIYTDEDDKDCILNQPVFLENACNNKTNEYKKNLFDESQDCDEAPYAAYWPNNDGVIVIPNFSVGTGIKTTSTTDEVETIPAENTKYYSDKICPEKLKNKYQKNRNIIESFAGIGEKIVQAYKMQLSPLKESIQKYVKYYGTEEEFIDEQIRLAYKFCPRVLEEWEKHRIIPGCNGTSSSDASNDSKSVSSVDLDKLKQAYEDAKANEQSLANRTLTAASIAATGVGGMELAMGLAEQKAAKAADQDMTAYIESFRCTYGKDKSVKGGPDEIELPGGNDANMIKYRNEYMTLAADLKVRKEALEMKPGIESEEILDKSQMGLYDQENTGIESGAYASLYRAKALNSEEDQAKLDEEAKKAKARVIGGATAVGVGIVGGMIGNSLINGKLGEKIRGKKDETSSEPGDLSSNTMINENLQRMEE